MELHGVILGIDLDGVCSDFYGRMCEIAAEWFERPLQELPTEVTYGLREWGVNDTEQYESLHRFAVTQRNLCRTSPMIPVPGNTSACSQMRVPAFVSSRIGCSSTIFHNAAVSQTIDWLDEHGIAYWDLCFMKAKEQVGADIYIEDAPVNVANLRQKGLFTICFANSTNKDVEPPRAADWQQAYNLFTSMSVIGKASTERERRLPARVSRNVRWL